MIIGTGNIKLREFSDSDAARLAELANNIKISRNLRDGFPHPYSLEDARKFIEKFSKLHPVTIFAIESNGKYVGNN